MVSKQRVICGLSVAAVWLIAIFLLPIWCLAGLLIAAAGICLYELCAMLRKAGYAVPFWSVLTAGVVWMGTVAVKTGMIHAAPESEAMGLRAFWGLLSSALLAALCIALFFRVLLDRRIDRPMPVMALTVTSFLYIPVMLGYLVELAMERYAPGAEEGYGAGIFLAFFLALVTKLCDTGGYFVGSVCGRHKMCPRLSPGKSWEGTAGGYAFSLAAATVVLILAGTTDWGVLAGLRWFAESPRNVAWFYLTMIVIVAVGILGDLVESLFKRQCGVKDSSALFPAMGGFFDTFDSLIFVPAAFIFMRTLGRMFCII